MCSCLGDTQSQQRRPILRAIIQGAEKRVSLLRDVGSRVFVPSNSRTGSAFYVAESLMLDVSHCQAPVAEQRRTEGTEFRQSGVSIDAV